MTTLTASKPTTIASYNRSLGPTDQKIAKQLKELIDAGLPGAESKIWHAHPVWFLNENPIVGYSKLKDSVRLLFWSGKSFDEPGLTHKGKFKDAECRYTEPEQINSEDLRRWLKKAAEIQWDYKNIVKRRGKLVRLK